jgi:Skp family chaperone for outer membrane proteins
MRVLPFLSGVTLLLGPSALPAAPTERPTPENLAAAQKDRDDAHVALEAAKTALADVEALLNKVKNDLSYEYRALDRAVQRRNHEEEAELRATIRELKEARYGLEVKRDLARLGLGGKS